MSRYEDEVVDKEPRHIANGTACDVSTAKDEFETEGRDVGEHHGRQAKEEIGECQIQEENIRRLFQELVLDQESDDDEQIPDCAHDEEEQDNGTHDSNANPLALVNPPVIAVCDVLVALLGSSAIELALVADIAQVAVKHERKN